MKQRLLLHCGRICCKVFFSIKESAGNNDKSRALTRSVFTRLILFLFYCLWESHAAAKEKIWRKKNKTFKTNQHGKSSLWFKSIYCLLSWTDKTHARFHTCLILNKSNKFKIAFFSQLHTNWKSADAVPDISEDYLIAKRFASQEKQARCTSAQV